MKPTHLALPFDLVEEIMNFISKKHLHQDCHLLFKRVETEGRHVVVETPVIDPEPETKPVDKPS